MERETLLVHFPSGCCVVGGATSIPSATPRNINEEIYKIRTMHTSKLVSTNTLGASPSNLRKLRSADCSISGSKGMVS